MSVDNLLYSEEWHYLHNPIYKQAIDEILKEKRLPLRLASIYEKDGSLTAYTFISYHLRKMGRHFRKYRRNV